MLPLQQTLTRSLRSASASASQTQTHIPPSISIPTSVLSSSCRVCQCRCGTFFSNASSGTLFSNASSSSQRQFATKRKAPSTRDREWARKHEPETRYVLSASKYLRKALHELYKADLLEAPPEAALAFLRHFKQLVSNARGGITADPTKTRELLHQFNINEGDVMKLTRVLLQDGHRESVYVSKKLILTLSRAGIVEATIRIMAEAVLTAKKKPSILHSRDVMFAKEHLSTVANDKLNYRAMVCEGKVARALGDEERAIRMWTDAMTAAVAAAQDREAREQRSSIPRNEDEHDPLELSTPWIELMLMHWERSKFKGKNEMAQCEWAMNIGCEQDDPTSHYYASTFVKRIDAQGGHIGTSEWLYHVTKAASSGHPKAAYDLGTFYAESGWKYIEDEPPDHVKPTAFDSYPGEAPSLLSFLLSFLGWKTRPKLQPHESVFHSAIFPSTAFQRYLMAYSWLSIAAAQTYAPAFLFSARMLLQDNLWAGADAPESALKLTSDRYSYASKEDYEAGHPLPGKDQNSGVEPADPPNPSRNRNRAKAHLREVFYAHEAHLYRNQVRKLYAKSRRTGQYADEQDLLGEHSFKNFGTHVQKFFRFPEVREMYEDQMESLIEQAKELCDQHNFDIYDHENALIYKAGTGKMRQVVEIHYPGL